MKAMLANTVTLKRPSKDVLECEYDFAFEPWTMGAPEGSAAYSVVNLTKGTEYMVCLWRDVQRQRWVKCQCHANGSCKHSVRAMIEHGWATPQGESE